jgi:hypothetical protein
MRTPRGSRASVKSDPYQMIFGSFAYVVSLYEAVLSAWTGVFVLFSTNKSWKRKVDGTHLMLA